MSLQNQVLENWLDNGGQQSDYPVHVDVEGKEWEHVTLKDGKSLNLFPFTRTAVIKLFSLLPEHQQTPRYLLRDIVERGVRNYLSGPHLFPSFTIERSKNYPWDPTEHRGRLLQFVRDSEFDRMDLFIRIWGNANLFSSSDNTGKRYLGGIPEQVFDEFKMAKITGIERNNDFLSGNIAAERDSGIQEKSLEPSQQQEPKPVTNATKASNTFWVSGVAFKINKAVSSFLL